MSIAAPATNPASNLTLTLPTTIGSADQQMKVDGSGNLGWANPHPYEFSLWYVTAEVDVASANQVVESWAESNAQGYERLGTAPSYSSGVWTLPSTGYWRVSANIIYFHTTSEGDTWAYALQHSTDSGSNWNAFGGSGGRLDTNVSAHKYGMAGFGVFKVTNASNSRFRVRLQGVNTSVGKVHGGSMVNDNTDTGTTLMIEKVANI